MTDEKALELFARCYNQCDFADVCRVLHKEATLEAYNRFYRHVGLESVRKALGEKAEDLRALPRHNRAYRGFLMTRQELLDLPRCERCVVLTSHDPDQAIGIVRIRQSPRRIREIKILDPAKCNYTRGEYCREGS